MEHHMSSSVAKQVVNINSQQLVGIPPSVSALPHVIREGRQTIGPDLAAWILKDAAFAGQRKSERHHVELLAHLMRQRRWSAGSQLAFCSLGGNLYLTNGKHRMNAVVASGIPQEFQVLITPCGSMTEVIADYYRHDTASRKRSSMEIINSTEMARNSGLPNALMNTLFGSALALDNDLRDLHYQQDALVRDTDAKIAAASGWIAEAQEYARLVVDAPVKIKAKLFTAGVAMVALMTIRHQPKLAELFWSGLAADDGLARSDPRKVLLLDFASRKPMTGLTSQRCLPAAIAWNAFFEHRPLHIIKISGASILRIAGTPITGRAK